MNREIAFATPHGRLAGLLTLPFVPRGVVVLTHLHGAHGAPALAATLTSHDLGAFALELLTAQEVHFPDSAHNVPLLTERLLEALELLDRDGDTTGLPIGIFADAATAPAAIRAAARRDGLVRTVVCHGGLVDLAGVQYLELLAAPLLMLLDAGDAVTEAAFRRAAPHLGTAHETHRLGPGESPGLQTARWFAAHLQPPAVQAATGQSA